MSSVGLSSSSDQLHRSKLRTESLFKNCSTDNPLSNEIKSSTVKNKERCFQKEEKEEKRGAGKLVLLTQDLYNYMSGSSTCLVHASSRTKHIILSTKVTTGFSLNYNN